MALISYTCILLLKSIVIRRSVNILGDAPSQQYANTKPKGSGNLKIVYMLMVPLDHTKGCCGNIVAWGLELLYCVVLGRWGSGNQWLVQRGIQGSSSCFQKSLKFFQVNVWIIKIISSFYQPQATRSTVLESHFTSLRPRVLVFHRNCRKIVGTARVSECLKFAFAYGGAFLLFNRKMSKNRPETTQILLWLARTIAIVSETTQSWFWLAIASQKHLRKHPQNYKMPSHP